MQIDIDLLFTWGAIAKEYKKNEVIFYEEDMSNFYYQIIEGSVKMFNSNDEGKEFTQGYFTNGQSFGEPPLLIDEVYPASAVAFQDSKIIKLSKDKFLKILEEYPSIQKNLLKLMARRIHSKAMTTKDIINQKPEFRIISFLILQFLHLKSALPSLNTPQSLQQISTCHQGNTFEIANHFF